MMPMTKEKRLACEQIIDAIKYLYAHEKISSFDYYKGLMSVACEFAKFEETTDTTALLSLIPSTFFTQEMQAHLDNDMHFLEICYNLAEQLKATGLVILAPEPVLTMPPAEA